MKNDEILESNKSNYEKMYETKRNFLQYPAHWVIGFYNSYMKKNLPDGKILDYGYGSGNNSVYLMERGYDVYGTEVADSSLGLLKQNLKDRNLHHEVAGKFLTISPDNISLPFEDNYFDFILSNQVLYFLPTEKHIKKVCRELKRILRPGGVVLFTMMGPKNYFVAQNTKKIDGKIHKVEFGSSHRLNGLKQVIYIVDTEAELKELFSDFNCIKVGYFDIDIMDGSNFHWIFIGTKT